MTEIPPHDRDLERDIVGSLVSRYHYGPRPNPGDFYDPTFARIARAIVEYSDRLLYSELAVLNRGEPVFCLMFEGLAEVLAELGDHQPRRTAFLAGILGADAVVTGPEDTAKLHVLASKRRRLLEIETELRELREPSR